ncbi:hypothetical protein AG1IA_01976 [Rhizoctonia solani AG-1 IA]|uniref:Uncharacterized protein n=1 Tax=Thanatephorus cucumeris (strain AG1-IA) TaxID=983506 RepID=L8X186_THACA|nr:hypothetical protein AG1IA_01976 [Rhizoctonia solani AG-1 IA]
MTCLDEGFAIYTEILLSQEVVGFIHLRAWEAKIERLNQTGETVESTNEVQYSFEEERRSAMNMGVSNTYGKPGRSRPITSQLWKMYHPRYKKMGMTNVHMGRKFGLTNVRRKEFLW